MPIQMAREFRPVSGEVRLRSNDPARAGGKILGAADICNKDEFKDFRDHVRILLKS